MQIKFLEKEKKKKKQTNVKTIRKQNNCNIDAIKKNHETNKTFYPKGIIFAYRK